MPSQSQDQILSQLQPIFQEVLDEPDARVTLKSNAANTTGWDSLAHIEIIEMVERHFHVKFALGELQDLKEVGDLVNLIEKSDPSRRVVV